MYALVEIKGKQYKAEKGALLRVDRIAAEEGSELEFDSVLMVSEEGDTKVGTPYVDGAKVKGKIEIQGMGKKLKIFRYKRRKNSTRRLGHRQKYSFFRVEEIKG